MEYYVTQPKDYWIAPNAINITLNALGDKNRIQCSVVSGAVIMCFLEDVKPASQGGDPENGDGLYYGVNHEPKRWPLSISPTYFNSDTRKYVYVAIPRSEAVGTQAVIVFPSEELDIYGRARRLLTSQETGEPLLNEDGEQQVSYEQIGSTDYFYIYLNGIISAPAVNAATGREERGWERIITDWGKLETAQGREERQNSNEWFSYSQVNQVVTFLKEIIMGVGSSFRNLILNHKNLTDVATSETDYTDSDTMVATPGYVEKHYLSKSHDDSTPYSLTVGGILRAATGYITSLYSNLVQSTNYTGDGIADTGYRLTANHNGHSKLTIDEIYVRMKAVFESLEVRERTYAGGDQIWSCAGNRINRVDYLGNVETSDHAPEMMDVHADGRPAGTGEGDVYSVPVPGDTYGYSYVKVPWLLRQMPFLLRHKFFGRLRRVRIILNEQEDVSGRRAGGADSQIGKIRRARCYFLAKDDDMEVHNWWRINDLARCQTMNLANTTRKTYLSGEDQKAGNIFWWRKVIGVSYEPVKLDDGKEYHYFDVAFDYLLEQEHPEEMATSVMEGSDIPAAQDSVVQFGNTIIEGRMNLMMMEVNGGDAVGYTPTTDAPCLKAYRGIYTFDLNKCWVGGSPRKMMLSPKSGYEFYGPNFKQVTEYDVVPVPVERGLWLDIVPTRDDYREHEMVRKCYYYDKVSHNGSYWLCSIVDGAHWVDGNGDYISDAAYSALTEAQKALCSRKQNYTIEEPSADSIDWTEVVKRGDKGDNMIRLDINNEMDMIPTTAALRIDVARTVETTVRLFDGATEVDISAATLSPSGAPASSIATFSQAADGKGKKLSWAFKAGQTMEAAYDITISYTYKNVAYTAVFTVSASKGEAVWQLNPSLSAIPFQRNADNTLTPASREVGLSLVKIDGGSTATYTSVQTGLTVRYSTSSMPSSASAGRGWESGNITVANTADNLYIALFNAAGTLLDRETIPVVKDGENGSNAVRLDISNEMDMIPTTSALRIDTARTVETVVRLFDGATEVDISTATLSPSGTPASSIATFSQAADGKGKKLSWAFKAGQTMAEAYEITISYTYKNVAYTAVFTVSASKGEAVWQLKPSMSAIPFQRNADNTLTPDRREVGLSLVKIDGGSTATYTSVQTGLTVRYSTSSMPSSASAGTGWSSGNIPVDNTADNLYIALFNASGVLLDRETIPVIKDGAKGDAGDAAPYYVDDYGIGASRTSHSDISSWSSSQPSPTAQKPYVWRRTRLYDPKTQQYGAATYVCLTGEKGDQGEGGYGLSLTPTSLILESMISNNQEVVNYVNNIVTVRVMKGSTPVQLTCSVLTTASSHSSNISISDSNIPVNNAGTYSTVTLAGGINLNNGESGFFTVRVRSNDNMFSQDVRINFYVNRAATFAREIKNGIETAMGAQTVYDYDELGNVIKTAYQADIQTSAKGLTQQFTEQISKAGDYNRNLFGFHKGANFSQFATIPFIQGYGLVVTSNNGNRRQGRVYNLGFENVGGYFVVTFMAKTNADFTSYPNQKYAKVRVDLCDVEPIHNIGSIGDNINIAVNNNWQSYEYHFFLPEEISNMSPDSYNGFIDFEEAVEDGIVPIITNQGAYIYIRHLKIERGQTATKFCEADEDVAYLGHGNVAKNLDFAPYRTEDAENQTVDGRSGVYRIRVPYLTNTYPWGNTTFMDYLYKNDIFNLEAGKCYTLSFWAKSSVNGFIITQHLYRDGYTIINSIGNDIYVDPSNGTIQESIMSDGQTQIKLSTTWTQYFVHFYVANNVPSVKVIPLRVLKSYNNLSSRNLAYIYMSDIELQEGYVTSAEYFASFINQNARRISLVQQSGTKLAGIDIQNGTVNLMGDRVIFSNSTGTVSGNIWIDPDDGTIHAINGEFSGEITATSGSIGGFSIGQNDLKNTDYGAGITIQNAESNPTKSVEIGKDATDDLTGNKCALVAESKGSNTYNTALYLNANGGTYNYAFHGNGNGVLNGLVFGYKTQTVNLGIGDSTVNFYLRDGATIIIGYTPDYSGNKRVKLPNLDEFKKCLGLQGTTTPFAVELSFINMTGHSNVYLRFAWNSKDWNGGYPKRMSDANTAYTNSDADIQIQSNQTAKVLFVYRGNNTDFRGYPII